MLCSLQLIQRWKQWAEKCKASLEEVLLDLTSFFWHASGVVFPWQAQNFTAFATCDILSYLEIKKECHTRLEKRDHRVNVPQLKSRMLLSFWGSKIPMAHTSYLCLNYIIGLHHCFPDGPPLKKVHLGPSRLALGTEPGLCFFLKGGGSAMWWREARHKL